ncbi:TetR family transcriptional regulator [Brachybacterium ginsengisoli]|uniref:TetR family transcriptional regulator n=1 Tax=Brachybacterium ginsengisoli TaxID=1331682 RepID=A0A291GZH7_9MICO|nr:TetR/AcrR family transcriptional regulator [Brachybacterium ginsengisoli]ATG55619.1 TetR family transcriptional regulator [Brachybacterium ginsengisoli]
MGRPAAFDRAEAVRAARDVFWSEGYETASMASLQQATGLSASSLYHAFGSKRGLFDAAIEDYLDQVVRPGLVPLTGPEVAPGALVAYFRAARERFADPSGRTVVDGCLLVNTACAGVARDGGVAEVVRAYRAELQAAFSRGVQARNPHQTPAQRERLVETCVSLLISALAMTRVDTGAALAALDAALSHLENEDTP